MQSMVHAKKIHFSSSSIIIYLVLILGSSIIVVDYLNYSSHVGVINQAASSKTTEPENPPINILKPPTPTVVDFATSSQPESTRSDERINKAASIDTTSSHQTPRKSKSLPLHFCNQTLVNKYQAQDNSITSQQNRDKSFCQDAVKNQGVVIGRSWGGLSSAGKLKWDTVNCNELLQFGQTLSCDKKFGWKSLSDWLDTTKVYASSKDSSRTYSSHVQCAKNYKSSLFCQFRNVSMDFSQVSITGASRNFGAKFFTIYNTQRVHDINMDIPGLNYVNTNNNNNNNINNKKKICDIYETRPVFMLSNDDIYNLGHFSNDLITLWSMLVMANRNGKDSILLSFDGFRVGGPAGGGNHRLMDRINPDNYGPFVAYYESWFGTLKKTKNYGTNGSTNSKVCFSELYLMPVPGVPYFWNDWSRINECSLIAPSPLHQSFNLYFRQQWIQKYGEHALTITPNSYGADIVHVVLEARDINPSKSNSHSSARHIVNLQELIGKLKNTIPNIKITSQNFAKISFPQQVALAHSAGVFVSMHGAGTTHIQHMAIGQSHCCALVELQPDHSQGFQTAHGYGNYARMFGLYYYRYEAEDGMTSSTGTRVNIIRVTELIKLAVDQVRGNSSSKSSSSDSNKSSTLRITESSSSSCLNNAKDTTQSIFPIDYFN